MQTDSSLLRGRMRSARTAATAGLAAALLAETSDRVYTQVATENPVPMHSPSVDKGRTEELQRLHCPTRHPDESMPEYRLRRQQSKLYGRIVR